MDLSAAASFAAQHSHGIFVTQRRTGRPQLSNVTYAIAPDGLVRVSITADRAKYHNLRREPWAAIHVSRDDFWAYAVLEGPAELSAVAASVDDDAVAELVEVYRAVAGEHDDWDDYRAAMVRDRRVVARIRPDHAYGMVP